MECCCSGLNSAGAAAQEHAVTDVSADVISKNRTSDDVAMLTGVSSRACDGYPITSWVVGMGGADIMTAGGCCQGLCSSAVGAECPMAACLLTCRSRAPSVQEYDCITHQGSL